jgi:hypothetical protein
MNVVGAGIAQYATLRRIMKMNEVWKDVKGYEGFYKISNLGKVYSLPKRNLKGYGTQHNGMMLKIHYSKTRYPAVTLKGCRKSVHRLIAEHFIPNPEGKGIVHHKDRNKNNFNINNLEWKTQSENLQEAHDGGHWKVTKKIVAAGRAAGIKSRIFTIKQAEMIKELGKIYSINSISNLLLVNRSVISNIVKGRTYHEKR